MPLLVRFWSLRTSVNVQLPCLQKDLRMGSISRDIVNFPSERCRRRSDMFTEVARLVPPDWGLPDPRFWIDEVWISTPWSSCYELRHSHPCPLPKPVCRTSSNNKWAPHQVCITFQGRGMGMNITAHAKKLVEMYHNSLSNDNRFGSWTVLAVRLRTLPDPQYSQYYFQQPCSASWYLCQCPSFQP